MTTKRKKRPPLVPTYASFPPPVRRWIDRLHRHADAATDKYTPRSQVIRDLISVAYDMRKDLGP